MGYKTWHGVEVHPIAFEMTGGRHIDTDKYLNDLFRKSVKIGDPYAMRRLYALRRECSFICARIVGQQTATAPSNFKNNPRRPLLALSSLPLITAAPSRALPLCPIALL